MAEQSGLHGQSLLDEYARYRRWGARFILIALTLLLLVSGLAALRKAAPPALDYNKLGVHVMLDDGRNSWPVAVWDVHLVAAARISSRGGIVVQLIRADDLEPARWQTFMDAAATYQMTPVLRLATTFDRANNWWQAPEADSDGGYAGWAQRYAEFLNALDWPGDQKHIILLNEPNNGHEWGGRPDPEAYARFVVDVAAVLRTEVDGVLVLNGALDLYAPHTGSQPFPSTHIYSIDANTFMDAMQGAQPGVFAQFDLWNSHAYPAGAFIEAPWVQEYRFDFLGDEVDTSIAPPAEVANRGINGYAWELWKLDQLGIRDLRVMITEFGWRHAETTDPDALDSGAGYPDAQTVARYVDLALRGSVSPFATGDITWQPLLADERVIAVANFALNGVPQDWGHSNWLQLDSAGTILGTYPAYDVVAAYPFP